MTVCRCPRHAASRYGGMHTLLLSNSLQRGRIIMKSRSSCSCSAALSRKSAAASMSFSSRTRVESSTYFISLSPFFTVAVFFLHNPVVQIHIQWGTFSSRRPASSSPSSSAKGARQSNSLPQRDTSLNALTERRWLTTYLIAVSVGSATCFFFPFVSADPLLIW